MADSEPPKTTQLSQPWKAWYQADKSLPVDFNPLDKPISLTLGAQGSFPQMPRQVNLSKPKQLQRK
jgi:hypothetical protein